MIHLTSNPWQNKKLMTATHIYVLNMCHTELPYCINNARISLSVVVLEVALYSSFEKTIRQLCIVRFRTQKSVSCCFQYCTLRLRHLTLGLLCSQIPIKIRMIAGRNQKMKFSSCGFCF